MQELRYDLTTTVAEAIEQLSSKINLQNYSTFALFDSSKTDASRSGALTGEVGSDESVLKDKEYIPDVLSAALSMRGGSGGASNSKLLFKKKLFRESDEAITEPQFVKLSYVQARQPCFVMRCALLPTRLYWQVLNERVRRAGTVRLPGQGLPREQG